MRNAFQPLFTWNFPSLMWFQVHVSMLQLFMGFRLFIHSSSHFSVGWGARFPLHQLADPADDLQAVPTSYLNFFGRCDFSLACAGMSMSHALFVVPPPSPPLPLTPTPQCAHFTSRLLLPPQPPRQHRKRILPIGFPPAPPPKTMFYLPTPPPDCAGIADCAALAKSSGVATFPRVLTDNALGTYCIISDVFIGIRMSSKAYCSRRGSSRISASYDPGWRPHATARFGMLIQPIPSVKIKYYTKRWLYWRKLYVLAVRRRSHKTS